MAKIGICPKCGKGPRELPYRDPKTKENICLNCYRNITGKSLPKKDFCPECGEFKEIPYCHPKTKRNICLTCYQKLTGRSLRKRGICPVCNGGPKNIPSLHPETKENICPTCFQKLTGKSLPKRGICSACERGPRELPYLHPRTKERICQTCYRRMPAEKGLICRWFQKLSPLKAACWIVDTARLREAENLKRLEILMELDGESERIKEVLKMICGPSFPVAKRIVIEFFQTEEGKKLRSLIK